MSLTVNMRVSEDRAITSELPSGRHDMATDQDRGASTPSAVDAYIAGFPPEVAERLTRLREIITKQFDGADETIRYGMPAVMVGKRYGLHYAGWKKHVALYPVPVFAEPLESAVAPYRSGKDSVTFRHHQELPSDLVERICVAIAEGR